MTMHGRSHCPGCNCLPSYVSTERANQLIDTLVAEYGSVRAAGMAYSTRYGLYQGEAGHSTGARLFYRIRKADRMMSATLDRIETLAAS